MKLQQSDAYKKYTADEQDYLKLVDDTYNRIYKENSATFWGPLFMLTLSPQSQRSPETDLYSDDR